MNNTLLVFLLFLPRFAVGDEVVGRYADSPGDCVRDLKPGTTLKHRGSWYPERIRSNGGPDLPFRAFTGTRHRW